MTVRDAGEKMLSSITIPTTRDVAGRNLDQKSAYAIESLVEFLNTCPSSLPPPNLTGAWIVTFASKNWIQSVFSELDEVIDLLANDRYVPPRKSLNSILGRDITVSCLLFQFLNDDAKTRVQISYLKDGRASSLVGELVRSPNKSLNMMFGPRPLHMTMIVAYTTPLDSPSDVLVLSDANTFPKCDNFLILQRTLQSSKVLQIAAAMGANSASNPLLSIHCGQDHEPRPIIRPVPQTA
ncbi:hypothetical protein Q1695_001807 [Nippostrongylus brasiliensis]|nr:hypothetical protein Q1695_001807 [Nippostrongylus brasiliensis]